jgi:hypothetical protein
MSLKSISVAVALAVVAGGALSFTVPARAQDAQAEMIGLHQLCDQGDRRACVKFGIMLGRAQQRHAEWRHLHPEWFWW